MTEPDLRPLRITTSMAINMLARGYYEHLANMTRGRFLSAEELRRAVEQHGHTLIEPPQSAFDEMRFRSVQEEPHRTYETSFALWTADEGRSPLKIELRLVHRRDNDYLLEIQSITGPADRHGLSVV